jgi:hypothetical protein
MERKRAMEKQASHQAAFNGNGAEDVALVKSVYL